MTMNLNKIVLTKILDIMPENLKPVTLLMDVLDIGKESAYRRLRGEKPFSMEEIYKLSYNQTKPKQESSRVFSLL